MSGRTFPGRPSSASSSSRMSCARTSPEGRVSRAAAEVRADGTPATLLVPGSELHRDRRGRAGLVREPGSVRRRGRVVGGREEPRVGTDRSELPRRARPRGPLMHVAASVRALADIDRDHAPLDRPSRRFQLLSLANQRTRRNRFERAHPSEDRQRVRAHDPVRFVADVALEQPERGVGPRTVEAVLLPAVEAEGVQHPLELAHVVTSEHRGAVIQGAIAELPAGLDELLPRVGTDEAVDLQVPLPLEPSDGGLRRRSERARRAPRRRRRRRAPSASIGCP